MGSLQSPPMAPPGPARLFATLVGAILFVAGIVGFFHDLSWLNYLYVASGVAGLLLAPAAPLLYAFATGAVYTALAITDFSNRGWAHLAVGLLGLAAFAASRDSRSRGSKSTKTAGKEPRKRSRRLKPRAKTATKGP
jgi:hypothetical protein